jgi:hypothetical protein
LTQKPRLFEEQEDKTQKEKEKKKQPGREAFPAPVL